MNSSTSAEAEEQRTDSKEETRYSVAVLIQFEISSNKTGTLLHQATLLVYKHETQDRKQRLMKLETNASSDNRTTNEQPSVAHLTNVHRIIHLRCHWASRPSKQRSISTSCSKELLKLTRLINTSQKRGGWKTLNASEAVCDWLKTNKRRYGRQLKVCVTTRKGDPVLTIQHFIRIDKVNRSRSDIRSKENTTNTLSEAKLASPLSEIANGLVVIIESYNKPTVSYQNTLNILSDFVSATSLQNLIDSDIILSALHQHFCNLTITSSEFIGSEIKEFVNLKLICNSTVRNMAEYQNVTDSKSETSINSTVPPDTPKTDYVECQPTLTSFPDKSHPLKSKHKRATVPVLKSPTRSYCRRQPLYINFAKFELDDWILEPSGYHAYYCAGECPVVLPDHMNATNHAVIQGLLHSANHRVVPPPCCVATALSPIPIIYLNAEGQHVIHNFKDMVVESCGCR